VGSKAMKIINRKAIEEFATRHANARKPLHAWLAVVSLARWKTPSDIRSVFRTADFLSGNRVIFNIKGNHYRLLVEVLFARDAVVILRIGTHSEYDEWEL